MNITLGSLFDGIGGFPYAGTFFGITPIWASEIEPWPIKVTEKHFPNMKHLGDITKINGAEIEPVDVITFGSPCTRLSVAGRHDGFDITFECQGSKEEPHEIYTNKIRATDKYQYLYNDICPVCGKKLIETNESALFFHAIRIISEMRDVTNGVCPRFIVWENVPGAFSSNKGEDFRAVLEEIAEAEIPMPRSGKWANAGMVRTERVDIAWRTLDAQYWGVPQRRRRIFLVADFGGQSAGEILFVEEGLSGHFAKSRQAREEAAATVGNGVKTAIPINTQIATRHNKLGRGTGFGIGEDGDPSFTLQEAHSHAVCCRTKSSAVAMCINNRYDAESQTFVIQNATRGKSQNGLGISRDDVSYTLDSLGNHAVAYPEPANTLLGKSNFSYRGDTDNVVCFEYLVRRLTPLETLRLQGFPDYWLDIEGMSDTQKYKAVGNSVAIPCVKFVLGGIARVLQI
jgi:DNA (cytosine-5)-methyltransferase 1